MERFDYTKLKGLREDKGITQKEMSNLLNMTQSNYSKLEGGLKKMDSLQTIENLSKAFEMTEDRLMGFLAGQENIDSSGMKAIELWTVHQTIKSMPLREDEFVFFATEVQELDTYNFNGYYPGPNMSREDADPDDPNAMLSVLADVKLIRADSVEVGFDYKGKKLDSVSIWLGGKQLGVIPKHYNILVNELIDTLLISRVVLIGNEDCIGGFYDTYLKVVFIATNAVNKSADFDKGRFSKLKFMSQKEVEEHENIE